MQDLTEEDLVPAPDIAVQTGKPSDFAANRPEAPPLSETLYSAFHLGNSVGSGLDYVQTQQGRVAAVKDWDAYDPSFDIGAYAERHGMTEHINAFVDAHNQADADLIAQRIGDERAMQEVLGRSGGWGLAAQVGAGVLDPINLLPVGDLITAGRAGNLAIGAARYGVEGAAVAGLNELGFHTTQDTRTAEESYWNMAGGAVWGGALGTAGAALRARVGSVKAARLEQQFSNEFRQAADPMQWQGGGDLSSASSRPRTTLAQEALAPALGLDKIEGKNPISDNPLIRTRQSPSVEVRRISGELAETPLYLKGNDEGVASATAAESRMKAWQYPLAAAINDVHGAYGEYRMRMKGEDGAKLSYSQFREQVASAMRRGDAHEIPEVAQAAKAARERIVTPLKEEAIRMGLLPEGVEVSTAESYLTRLYDKDLISANRNDFIKRLADHFEAEQVGAKDPAPRIELEGQAEDITNQILGHSDARTTYDLVAGPRGPLKERTLNVPDEVVEPYLVNDVERVLRTYARTMAGDVELARAFERPDMADQIAAINADFDKLARRTSDGPAQAALTKQRKRAIADIEAMRDRVRGLYGIPDNPQGLAVRAGRFARNLNFLTKLGGMTVSSIPDVGSAIMTHGLTRVMGTGAKMLLARTKGLKLAEEEVRLSGTALDMVLHSRAMDINDVFSDMGRYSKAERGMEWITAKMGRLSLMDHWNSAMKQLAGLTTQTRMLQAIEAGSRGAKKEILAYHGTAGKFADIDPLKSGEGASFFTTDKTLAEEYAASRAVRDGPEIAEEKYGAEIERLTEEAKTASGGRLKALQQRLEKLSSAWSDLAVAAGHVRTASIDVSDALVVDMQGESIASSAKPERYIEAFKEARAKGKSAIVFENTNDSLGKSLASSHRVIAVLSKEALAKAERAPVRPPNAGEMRRLRMQGITEEMAGRIASEFRKHGTKDSGVWSAGTVKWSDREAASVFRAALVKETDRIIVSPGQEKPLWMSTEWGKTIGQFKSFMFASMSRTIIHGLQQRDLNALQGLISMTGLGMLSVYLKAKLSGAAMPENPQQWVAAGIDGAGLASWVFEANNVSLKLFGQGIPTGNTKYAGKSGVESLLGPTIGAANDVRTLAKNALGGKLSASDVHRARRLIPFQNLFYLRWLFDQAEKGVDDAAGLPQRKP